MHKIYLDHCVFQDLKKKENKELLEKVLQAKRFAVFPYSIAHMHDLSRDKGEEKFNDMDFMETISDSNLYTFSDRTEFSYRKPKEYFNSFDWPDTSGIELFESEEGSSLMNLLDSIPLPFKELVDNMNWTTDAPSQMKDIFTKTTTFGDFTKAMIEFSHALSVDQPQFKEHLKHLHEQSSTPGLYTVSGIEGYDGKNVIDKQKFWASYANKFIQEGKEKSRYDLFLDMYYSLEIYGFVKGKPKKQKMMNLINDSRHAFFGTVCDIIVSKDADFLEKTRFMYNIEELGTRIIDITELSLTLEELEKQALLTIEPMLAEINAPFDKEQILRINEPTDTLDQMGALFILLKQTYYAYFNVLRYTTDTHGTYWSFLKKPVSLSRGTLIRQIEYIIARLIDDLGPDHQGKGKLNPEEEIKDNMELRGWRFIDYYICLNLENKLNLVIYPIEYLEKKYGPE